MELEHVTILGRENEVSRYKMVKEASFRIYCNNLEGCAFFEVCQMVSLESILILRGLIGAGMAWGY